MLPSWHDRVQLALCPDRIILTRLGAGWRPSLTAKSIVPCGGGQAGIDWRPALSALRETLIDQTWSGAHATVVLSNHFVNYQLIPWHDNLANADEWRAMIRYSFQQVYGEFSDHWELRWSEGGFGRPLLASAIDPELLLETRAIVAENGLKLDSVQPYLMAAFNHCRGEMAGRNGGFLLQEPGRIGLACFRHGVWSGLAFERMPDQSRQTLSETLQRMLLIVGGEGAPDEIFAFMPETAEADLPAANGTRTRSLPLKLPSGCSLPEDLAYAMALTGS